MRVRLGELLVRENRVTPQQLQEALGHQRRNGVSLRRALVTLGFIEEETIASLLAAHHGVRSIDIEHFEIDPAVIKLISAETAHKYQVLPLSRAKTTLTIAMADPGNFFAMDDIRFMTNCNLEPVMVGPTLLENAIEKYYRPKRGVDRRQQAFGDGESRLRLNEFLDSPGLTMDDVVVGVSLSGLDIDVGPAAVDTNLLARLILLVLVDSVKRGARDIHLEPYEKEFRIRCGIDGILHNLMALPLTLKDPLTSHVKSMARLDIAEKRLPQEGQFRVKMAIGDRRRDLWFRVSCLPTLFGETIVLRFRDESNLTLDMKELGFEASSLDRFTRAIAGPRGLVLVTGPAGSGKSNTLYAAMVSLHGPDTKIIVAEGAAECSLHGIDQVQIRGDKGLSFPAALRSILLQDPDVLAVDEIEDEPTAEAVVRLAARAGPLLVATMSDTDAASAVLKIAHMSGQPFLLGQTLSMVVAQALVRRICAHCKSEITGVPSVELIEMGVPPDKVGAFKLYTGKGCGACYDTGYHGRVGLFEVMDISEVIRDLIKRGASATEIRRGAVLEGMLTLRMCGIEKLIAGITTVEEVLRETTLR